MPSSQPNQRYTVRYARTVILDKEYMANSEEHALALALADEHAGNLHLTFDDYPVGHIDIPDGVTLVDIVDDDTIWEARLAD